MSLEKMAFTGSQGHELAARYAGNVIANWAERYIA